MDDLGGNLLAESLPEKEFAGSKLRGTRRQGVLGQASQVLRRQQEDQTSRHYI
jgi:hypothetical protein